MNDYRRFNFLIKSEICGSVCEDKNREEMILQYRHHHETQSGSILAVYCDKVAVHPSLFCSIMEQNNDFVQTPKPKKSLCACYPKSKMKSYHICNSVFQGFSFSFKLLCCIHWCVQTFWSYCTYIMMFYVCIKYLRTLNFSALYVYQHAFQVVVSS